MKQVGPYEIREEIARGGMGVVYRAHDPRIDRDVAVKVLLGYEGEELEFERFRREAMAMARLRHPGIVGVHELGWARGKPYLVMDLVEGESLYTRLKRGGPLDPRLAVRWTIALAEALEVGHGVGVIHRDLKPDNVLIKRDEEPVLVDFGLAKLQESGRKSLTEAGTIMGTPAYMPPEQARGLRADPRSDVYGLGAVFYAMLTGRPPFAAETQLAMLARVIEEPPAPPRELRAEIPEWVEAVCLRCLAKAPHERYPSCAALADALRAPVHSSVRWAKRWTLGFGFVALVAVVLLVVMPRIQKAARSPLPTAAPPPVAKTARADPAADLLREALLEGAAAFEAGDHGRASRFVEEALALDPTETRALILRARLRSLCTDQRGSLVDLRTSQRLNLEGLELLGEILATLKRHEEGFAHGVHATLVAPSRPEAHAALGFIHLTYARNLLDQVMRGASLGGGQDARPDVERIRALLGEAGAARRAAEHLAKGPAHGSARSRAKALQVWVHLVEAELAKLDRDQAGWRAALERAVEIARESLLGREQAGGIRLAMLLSLMNLGDFEGGRQVASDMLAIQPRNTQFLVFRGYLYRQEGLFHEAKADFDLALTYWPTYPNAYGNRAELFLRRAMAGFQAGQLELAREDLEAARADIETVSELCPTSTWVQARVKMYEDCRERIEGR